MPDNGTNKGGRQSTFSHEIAARLCELMATGESLRSICRAGDMPAESTVRSWATADVEGFAAQYARAREAQMDALAEEIIEIADDSGADASVDDNGIVRVDGEAIQRARLRVDTRKWIMSKIAPKKYGDKITHAGDAENPIAMVPVLNVFTRAADDQPGTAPKAINGARLNGH